MDAVVSKFASVVFKQPIKDDDTVDRMHHFITFAIFFFFATLSAFKEYLGEPISCWSSSLSTGGNGESQVEHINTYCWSHDLHYPSEYEQNASKVALKKPETLLEVSTAFFRWATFMLVIQAFLFKVPNYLWKSLKGSTGADLMKIRDLVKEAQTSNESKDKKQKLDEVVSYFEKWVTKRKQISSRRLSSHSNLLTSVCFCYSKKSGNYLSSLYILVKFLNLLNVVANFLLLMSVLDMNYWKYGVGVIATVVNEGDWHDTYNFPRLLICEFEDSEFDANKNENEGKGEHKVQCTMSNNLVLERLYALIWFWLVFLLFITVINLIWWLFMVKLPCSVRFFDQRYIKSSRFSLKFGLNSFNNVFAKPGNDFVPTEKHRKDFVQNYLKNDGIFILRILEQNTDNSIMSDLVNHLWIRYCCIQKHEEKLVKIDDFSTNDLNSDSNALIQNQENAELGFNDKEIDIENTKITHDSLSYENMNNKEEYLELSEIEPEVIENETKSSENDHYVTLATESENLDTEADLNIEQEEEESIKNESLNSKTGSNVGPESGEYKKSTNVNENPSRNETTNEVTV